MYTTFKYFCVCLGFAAFLALSSATPVLSLSIDRTKGKDFIKRVDARVPDDDAFYFAGHDHEADSLIPKDDELLIFDDSGPIGAKGVM
ncbi:hypothetical protein BJ138DRAFT_1143682, partial [Hygrophoropsis aurantiaca]